MSNISNSYDLFVYLKDKNLLINSPSYWWPYYGTFDTLVGTILTQNTQWSNVEKSLQNLRKYNLLSIEKIATIDLLLFTQFITPSGF